jgi:proteasome lid subunit RPN8/RPN11
VKISHAALDEVHKHAAEGYPYEICGLLLGPPGSDRVTEARRAHNTVTDRAHDRYEIDPRDQLRIQREADDVGLDVVGYYHSHPDHPARASITDAERSWAGPLYLIVSCQKGTVVDGNAFVAVSDGGPMQPVPMEVVA